MIDGVVIGAGPAGLLASAALTARGVDHVVLERARPGASWRAQRWDGFRLNTPGWASAVFDEVEGEKYFTAAELLTRLDVLAAAADVREGVEVRGLSSEADGFALDTSTGLLRCRTVVVATGDENVARLPAMAGQVRDRVRSMHAAEYRSPTGLPPGRVLVVGSGQSGCQITGELLAAGREVVLATSPVGRVPTGYRGQDAYALLVKAGFFDQSADLMPDPRMLRAPQPILAPGAQPLSLQRLARAGARLTGRVTAVDQGVVRFDGSAAANVHAGDAFAAQAAAMLDAIITRFGIDAPPPAADEDDGPVRLAPPEPLALDELAAIVWATGFTGDFGWLHPELLGADGSPRHTGTQGAAPGLAYVGLRWLTRRSSAMLLGMPADAASAADRVQAALIGARSVVPTNR